MSQSRFLDVSVHVQKLRLTLPLHVSFESSAMRVFVERAIKVLKDLLITALPRNILVPVGLYLALFPKIKVTINCKYSS